MQGVAAAEHPAFNELYGRHYLLLRKVIGQVLLSDADVDETVQDVFVEIWNRAASFDPTKGKALGWMVCMARRRAIDHLRKICSRAESSERLRLQGEQDAPNGANEHGVTAIYEDEAVTADRRRFLRKVVGELPAEQERVVHLAYYQAMSQREIARHTGVAHGTIKTRLELARSKLLRQLAPLREELSCLR